MVSGLREGLAVGLCSSMSDGCRVRVLPELLVKKIEELHGLDIDGDGSVG